MKPVSDIDHGRFSWQLTAEDQLLVRSARVSLTEQDVSALVELCGQHVDWEAVLDGAAWHKLEGLLFRHLGSPALSPLVPAEVKARLGERYRYHLARQMFFRKELKEILQSLGEASVEVILLKGAALVNEIYAGDLGVRPMSDLDLLVRPVQASLADRVLRARGYRSGVDAVTEEQMRSVDRQLAALSRFGSPVVVEIHTHLVEVDSPIRFDIDAVWDARKESNGDQGRAWTLKPTPLLASLSINYLKDRRFYSYSALGQLCDVAEVLRKHEGVIDWDQFQPGGRFHELRGVVFATLYAARKLLNAPVAETVLNALAPRDFNPVVADLLIRDRVLGRVWVAKNLSGGRPGGSKWSLPARMARRVFLSRHQFEYRRRSSREASWGEYLAANLRRVWEAASVAGRLITRPRRLYDDVSVDRWLSSLYRTGD